MDQTAPSPTTERKQRGFQRSRRSAAFELRFPTLEKRTNALLRVLGPEQPHDFREQLPGGFPEVLPALNGLPRLYHAVFTSKNFHRFSDNGFFISIEAKDPRFNVNETKKLLEDIGGRNIEVLED